MGPKAPEIRRRGALDAKLLEARRETVDEPLAVEVGASGAGPLVLNQAANEESVGDDRPVHRGHADVPEPAACFKSKHVGLETDSGAAPAPRGIRWGVIRFGRDRSDLSLVAR